MEELPLITPDFGTETKEATEDHGHPDIIKIGIKPIEAISVPETGSEGKKVTCENGIPEKDIKDGKQIEELSASDFGFDEDKKSFLLTDKYLWTKKEYTLPLTIKFTVDFQTKGEMIPVFSQNKKEWGQGSDALSWYLATNRDDFTYRIGLFDKFPKIVQHQKIRAVQGKPQEITCEIFEDHALYYIDGELYAEANYPVGEIPKKGYFGFALYARNEVKEISKVSIGSIKEISDVSNGDKQEIPDVPIGSTQESDKHYLSELDFGFDEDRNSFYLTDEYLWSQKEYSLPLTVTFTTQFYTEGGIYPVFSHNKIEWGQGNSDALSWTIATDRDDFTFRTGLFSKFPEINQTSKITADRLTPYEIKCEIFNDHAKFYVDGELNAEATYPIGEVPEKGYFGFAVYARNQVKEISNVLIEGKVQE